MRSIWLELLVVSISVNIFLFYNYLHNQNRQTTSNSKAPSFPSGEFDSSEDRSFHKEGNDSYLQIPSDLLINTQISRIWKFKSKLKIRKCDLIWKNADDKNIWKGYSKLGDSTKDVSIDQLDYEISRPLERVINKLGDFANEKFLVKLFDFDGKAAINFMEEIDYKTVLRLKGLGPHKDNSDVSFIMLLNSPDHFTGGGTHFEILNKTVFLEQGEILIFPGQLVHWANPITSGKRYILSGFITFSEEYLKMKRLATLKTMPYLH